MFFAARYMEIEIAGRPKFVAVPCRLSWSVLLSLAHCGSVHQKETFIWDVVRKLFEGLGIYIEAED
jgi:hypothetical protein